MTHSPTSEGSAQTAVPDVDTDVRVVVQGSVCEGVVLRRSGVRLQVESLLDGEPAVGWFEETAVYPIVRAPATDDRSPSAPPPPPREGIDLHPLKPFDASLPRKDRYRSVVDEPPASVLIGERWCPAQVLGRNGPRVQVRLTIEGRTHIRWLDAEALTAAPGRGRSD